MNEQEWLDSDDPAAMIRSLNMRTRGKNPTVTAAPRRFRLFACACCRRLEKYITHVGYEVIDEVETGLNKLLGKTLRTLRRHAWTRRQAVYAELGMDDSATANLKRLTIDAIDTIVEKKSSMAATNTAFLCAEVAYGERHIQAPDTWDDQPCPKELTFQTRLLRDIFGNPFRHAYVKEAWLSWNNGAMPAMAQAIYEHRQLPSGLLDRDRLGVLADALEDAGCEDAEMLEHCRSDQPHVKGCWVVDLLFTKR